MSSKMEPSLGVIDESECSRLDSSLFHLFDFCFSARCAMDSLTQPISFDGSSGYADDASVSSHYASLASLCVDDLRMTSPKWYMKPVLPLELYSMNNVLSGPFPIFTPTASYLN